MSFVDKLFHSFEFSKNVMILGRLLIGQNDYLDASYRTIF